MVITHELAHVFHLDRARGIWSLGRWVFGRSPVLFPNSYTPSWVKEGLAVHYESRFTGFGRQVSTEFPLVARAAALDSLLPPLGRWSLSTTRYPRGGTAYTYGSLLMARAVAACSRARPTTGPIKAPIKGSESLIAPVFKGSESLNGPDAGALSENRSIPFNDSDPLIGGNINDSDPLIGGASRADGCDGKGMRRYVDATAATAIPYLLQTNARIGFGESFTRLWQRYRDSLMAATSVIRPDAENEPFTWESPAGFYASYPRWLANDSLVWSASDGREVTGAYVAAVRGGAGTSPQGGRRIAWRNGLDVNVPLPGASGTRPRLLYAQPDYRDLYVVRSDLYRGQGGAQQRITAGARLVHPDIRRDGAIVAVQLDAGTAHLVRVSDAGAVQRLANGAGRTMWAEPRWSPDGAWIAAVQRLPSGEQRVVVLDTLGNIWQAVAGSRGVYSSPSWTPDGARLVWASDRSGRMQLETARLGDRDLLDTTRWREPRDEVRQVSRVRTGVYDPSVSPDGRHVAVVVQRGDGMHVAVLPLDTVGVPAENTWYTAAARDLPTVMDAPRIATVPTSRYRALRQLLPRYWMPNIGEGRDGRATYGLTSSGFDILERHQWDATVLVEPRRGETDAYASYRYAGLGVPVLDLSASQEWDATFRAVNDSGTTLGFIARRRRFATFASTWSVPRVRWSVSGTMGAQYEWRDFTATVDSVLGDANSLLRTGTRYPSLFLNTGVSTARRALRGVSVEEGVSLSTSTSYRWRQDAPSLGSWRTIATGRAYVPIPLPGYARHVLAVRTSAGYADTKTVSEFQVGGTSGVQAELVPGVTIGDPGRAFPVRGIAPGTQRGIRALGGTVEYRAPLVMLRRAPSPFTVYTDRVSVALFSDAGRAWCPASLRATPTAVCDRSARLDGWIASAGGELVIDLAVAYDEPYRLRLGAAAPYLAPAGVRRGGAWYVTLGGYF